MIDRRKTPRIKDENLVKIMPISEDKDQPKQEPSYHLTKDISLGGVKIHSSKFFQTNTLLGLEISLTDLARYINMVGEVRWIKTIYVNDLFEMGIKFVDVPPDSFEVLKERIEKLKRQSLFWK